MRFLIEKKYIISSLSTLLFFSCETYKAKNTSTIDSIAVIEKGLEHILKTNIFAPEFYANPIQIIKSKNVPANTKFMVNGRQVELVNRQLGPFYTKNVFQPLPFVDVKKLKSNSENIIEIDLGFPSIGRVFQLKIRNEKSDLLKIVEQADYQTKGK